MVDRKGVLGRWFVRYKNGLVFCLVWFGVSVCKLRRMVFCLGCNWLMMVCVDMNWCWFWFEIWF